MASLPLVASLRDTRYAQPVARQEWKLLLTWAFIWIVIANAGFAVMWFVGAPPRWSEILITGMIGLFVRRRPAAVQLVAFVGATVFSLLSFVSGLFNLDMGSLIYSLRFFAELDPTKSTEYMVAGMVVVMLMAAAARLLRRDQSFTDLRALGVAVALLIMTAQVDEFMGAGMWGHYNRDTAADTPFTSATNQARFAAVPAGKPRHLMIVMVESLGVPVNNPEMDRLLFQRYRTPEVAQRFGLEYGTTAYFKSTTAAEVRELCGRWGEYYDLLDRQDEGCLPARLRRLGYQTSAYHSFSGEFFYRDKWYPNIGFEQQKFAPELLAEGARECGGMFPGACDRDVPALLAARLKQADQPQFIYWLTVNSHLPVPTGMNLDVDNCENLSVKLAESFPMICRQFAVWDAIDRALVREITARDFPPTDILIVGDHMPPYFDRRHRKQFAFDRVPYLYLRWKDEGDAAPGKLRLAAQMAEAVR